MYDCFLISFNAVSEFDLFLKENFSTFSPAKIDSFDLISLSSYRKLLAMVQNSSGLKSHDIDYINAHGTSTPSGDKVEVLAIERMFEECKRKINVFCPEGFLGRGGRGEEGDGKRPGGKNKEPGPKYY